MTETSADTGVVDSPDMNKWTWGGFFVGLNRAILGDEPASIKAYLKLAVTVLTLVDLSARIFSWPQTAVALALHKWVLQ